MKIRLNRSARVKIGVLGICVLALLSSVRWLGDVARFDPQELGKDRITLYERRFEGLRKVLPPRGVVGYISNREIGGGGDEIQESYRHLQTQYVLAPLIVLRSPNQRLVIGNFHEVAVDSATLREWNVEPLARFGQVVLLLNRNIP